MVKNRQALASGTLMARRRDSSLREGRERGGRIRRRESGPLDAYPRGQDVDATIVRATQ